MLLISTLQITRLIWASHHIVSKVMFSLLTRIEIHERPDPHIRYASNNRTPSNISNSIETRPPRTAKGELRHDFKGIFLNGLRINDFYH
jgi:hypothetical protein